MARGNIITISSEALFRYRVVGAVRGLVLCGRSLADAVRLVAADLHAYIHGTRRVSERTIYRWFAAYKRDGIEGLDPKLRGQVAGSNVLSEQFVYFLCKERERDRDASVPELIKRARELGILRSRERVSRSTVWRTMRRLNLVTTRRKVRKRDSRRFQYPERMQMCITDFVHFRAGARRLRRVACYILDDATRYGLDVLVSAGTGEPAVIFLTLLHFVLVNYGLMDVLYSDHGSAYISNDTARVMLQLDLAHVMGEARYPEAHGKVERFNQSAKHRVLRGFDGSPEVDPDPGSLTLRLRHDLHEIYNNTPHEGLGGETPRQRWESSERDLVPAPDEQWLINRFTVTETRRVSNDHVISYEGQAYEVPRGLSGEMVEIHRRVLDSTLHLMHLDRLIELYPVDLAANAITPRAKHDEHAETASIIKTASALNFERAYGSVLNQDGGCPDKEEEE